jgi:hypothetical protein
MKPCFQCIADDASVNGPIARDRRRERLGPAENREQFQKLKLRSLLQPLRSLIFGGAPSTVQSRGANWAMKRPRQRAERFLGKQKALMKSVSTEELDAAANGARYAPSDYHCKENGRLRRRVKPQTPCPRDFTLQEAGDALRASIRARRVSRDWINGFPRRVWYKQGDQWYEACTNTGTAGTYHAYPIEVVGLPPGLQR